MFQANLADQSGMLWHSQFVPRSPRMTCYLKRRRFSCRFSLRRARRITS